MISRTYTPVARDLITGGQRGLNSLADILSGRDSGQGFSEYTASTGYNNIFDEAMRGVTGSNAARGLLASGSTVRGLADRGGQLAQQNFANWLGQRMNVSQAQLGGGQNVLNTIAGAGQVQRGAQEGFGKQLGQAIGLAAAASDRRLKDDIVLLEREPDGLGIYSFRYKWDDKPTVGVMADEVAELRPHALGPTIKGFATVVYEAL
jgi:hypothetical protein